MSQESWLCALALAVTVLVRCIGLPPKVSPAGCARRGEPCGVAGGVRPAHIKDRVRALGPTVRPDLTLKPADAPGLHKVTWNLLRAVVEEQPRGGKEKGKKAPEPKYVPADAKWVVHVDVDRLAKSQTYDIVMHTFMSRLKRFHGQHPRGGAILHEGEVKAEAIRSQMGDFNYALISELTDLAEQDTLDEQVAHGRRPVVQAFYKQKLSELRQIQLGISMQLHRAGLSVRDIRFSKGD